MKFLLLAFILGLVGCGEPQEPVDLDTRVGQEVVADQNDKLTEIEVNTIKTVCNALSSKDYTYFNRIRTNSVVEYDFEVVEKDCGEDEYSEPSALTATLARENGSYTLNPSDDSLGFMEDVLIADSKILNNFCDDDVDGSTPRYVLNGDYGVWIQAQNNDTGLCDKRIANESSPRARESHCLILTTARKETDDRYKIESAELFEVVTRINGSDNGVVRKRSYTSGTDCDGEDEKFTRVQYLID